MEKLRAAWYEHQGDPYHSLVVGEMPDPVPGAGEVRLAVTVSGLSPGDVKKRAGWQGSAMSYPRVIPHSDGAGTIDAVGPGVTQDRIGEHVWCYGAQSYRPFGTAAEYVVVPSDLAIPLPAATDTQQHPGDLDAHQIDQALQLGAHHAFRNDDPDLAQRIAGLAPGACTG